MHITRQNTGLRYGVTVDLVDQPMWKLVSLFTQQPRHADQAAPSISNLVFTENGHGLYSASFVLDFGYGPTYDVQLHRSISPNPVVHAQVYVTPSQGVDTEKLDRLLEGQARIFKLLEPLVDLPVNRERINRGDSDEDIPF